LTINRKMAAERKNHPATCKIARWLYEGWTSQDWLRLG
jgi:hypothetical protein